MRIAITIVIHTVAVVHAAGWRAGIFATGTGVTVQIHKPGGAGPDRADAIDTATGRVGKAAAVVTAATVTSIAVEGEPFVGHQVAVVVDSVANFDPGVGAGVLASVRGIAVLVYKSGIAGARHAGAAGAGRGSVRSHTNVVAHSTMRRIGGYIEAFVRVSVTVVIHFVADFVAGRWAAILATVGWVAV